MIKAKEILELENKWQQMDSRSLIDNVRSILYCHNYVRYTDQYKVMMEITDSKKHTAEAWMNGGREDVKIPFLKLCKIVSYYGLDIDKVLIDYQCEMENQEERYKYIYNRIIN